MLMNDVRKIAKEMGVKSFGMKKTDIIRAVQNAERAVPCYGTARVEVCGEDTCLWRADCLAVQAGHARAARKGPQ